MATKVYRGAFFTNDSQRKVLVLTGHYDSSIMPVTVNHATNDFYIQAEVVP